MHKRIRITYHLANQAYIALFFLLNLFTGCQNPAGKNESAIDLIQKSLRNSGQLSQPDLQLSVQIICPQAKNRGQSLNPDPPYNIYQVETRFQIDRVKDQEVALNINPFNGFLFKSLTLTDQEGTRIFDYLSQSVRSGSTSGFDNYRHFPQPYLNSAIKDSANLVYQGLVNLGGESLHLIVSNSAFKTKLYLEKNTLLLKKVEREVINQPYGNGTLVKEFDGYQSYNGIKLPSKIKSGGPYSGWGTLFNYYEVSNLEEDISLPDRKAFKKLNGDYPESALVALAEDVYMVQNVNDDKFGISDYNVLVAEFEDHIAIGEAPLSNEMSMKVIDMVKQQFPEKPIKYMVQSHHHSDHIGGVREYIAQEITLVVASGTTRLFNRIAGANWSLQPDSQHKNPMQVRFRTVNDSLNLKDETNEMRIVNIGPIPHVNDMLVIYFPRQKLLWQTDMISYGEWPLTIEPSRILRERIARYGWEVKVIAGVHGRVLQGEALDEYLANPNN